MDNQPNPVAGLPEPWGQHPCASDASAPPTPCYSADQMRACHERVAALEDDRRIWRDKWYHMQNVAAAAGFSGCTDAIVKAEQRGAEIARQQERIGELTEALRAFNAHFNSMIANAREYLPPHGITSGEFISRTIVALDGPEQRRIQERARALLPDQPNPAPCALKG